MVLCARKPQNAVSFFLLVLAIVSVTSYSLSISPASRKSSSVRLVVTRVLKVAWAGTSYFIGVTVGLWLPVLSEERCHPPATFRSSAWSSWRREVPHVSPMLPLPSTDTRSAVLTCQSMTIPQTHWQWSLVHPINQYTPLHVNIISDPADTRAQSKSHSSHRAAHAPPTQRNEPAVDGKRQPSIGF